MTAGAAEGPPDLPFDPRVRSAPREIRNRLTPEAAGDFDRQWREAMGRAVEALDLTDVLALLDGWERVAWLTQRLGPEGYRQFLQNAHDRTGLPGQGDAEFGVHEANALIRARLAAER